ncbi:MAG: flagellar filament capping protein FliD [Lachnospiraceae bacterium]|nr:flagellar filament capping protein FliD [Lachnospiraceae bacterium]
MGISLNGLNSGMADTYSTLLGGMSGGDNAGGVSSLLGDYAAIKNGSYGKMLKSYYAKLEKQKADESGETDQKKAGKIKDSASASSAAALYKSASALGSLNYDDRSEENIDKITDSVSAFIKDYNSLMKNAAKSENTTVQKQAESLYNSYYSNYKLFSKIGITMNSDRTLSLDEDTIKKALADTEHGNGATVKTLFGGIGSFADKAVNKASQIYRAAGDGEAVTSSKAKYAGAGSSSSTSASSTSSTKDKDKNKTVTDASSAAAANTLYKSIEKLGSMNISNTNKEEVYKAFSSFVEDYNALINNTDKSANSNVVNQAGYLKSIVSSNKSAFARIGVTVNSDKTLSIDEKKFKDADMSGVKNLFTGAYSTAEKMTDRVNQIYRYATQGDSLSKKTYDNGGSGVNVPTMGSMVDTIL